MHLMFIVWLGLRRPILEVRINQAPIYTKVIGAPPPAYTAKSTFAPQRTVLERIEKRFSCLLNQKIPDVSHVGYSCLQRGPLDNNSTGF